MKALLIGAGASYECGMPLVWEFTNILRSNVLKRLDTKLFDFRESPDFRYIFEKIISNPKLHYEEMIGELERIRIDNPEQSSVATSTALQLTECVQILLLEDQQNTTEYFKLKCKDYDGIKSLISKHGKVDIFSLNHDINLEEICKHHGIKYKDGFYESEENNYSHIARFKVATKEQLDSGNLNFLTKDEEGINIIKLHGSLDIFAAEDKNLYLKCTPDENEPIGGHINEIRKIEQHNREICQESKVRATMELCVYDKNGELQFLRRSLLSGSHKFSKTFDQIAPRALFEEFKNRINHSCEIDVIGYGFGDPHINNTIKNWLINPKNKLTIYDPYRTTAPDFLSDQESKIEIKNYGLTRYLDSQIPRKRNIGELFREKIFEKTRESLKKRRLNSWKEPDN
ncbi:hypothetical protein ACA097_16280 [Pseudomonas sp. QL9]|uniref:hypothetical protein n=1 Tax=Pseudomonas sp. QL9 TaxID=3242725 RepID=UPI00352A6B6C